MIEWLIQFLTRLTLILLTLWLGMAFISPAIPFLLLSLFFLHLLLRLTQRR